MKFIAVLAAFIYPIQGSWSWGGGFLTELGFSDFAGSTIVHSVGGWAALTGAILLGPRRGKYGADGRVNPLPGANLPLATLGTFILWMGWFGFNGGSQLALGSAADATAMSIVYVNTNLAAAAGVLVAMAVTQVLYRKIDLTMSLNGALAGLVAVCAGSDIMHPIGALATGAIAGGLFVWGFSQAQNKWRIDDVLGVWPLHGMCGAWGGIAAGIFGLEALGGIGGVTFASQLMGTVIGVTLAGVAGFAVYGAIKATIGIRLDEDQEYQGADLAIHHISAYPEEDVRA